MTNDYSLIYSVRTPKPCRQFEVNLQKEFVFVLLTWFYFCSDIPTSEMSVFTQLRASVIVSSVFECPEKRYINVMYCIMLLLL